MTRNYGQRIHYSGVSVPHPASSGPSTPRAKKTGVAGDGGSGEGGQKGAGGDSKGKAKATGRGGTVEDDSDKDDSAEDLDQS